MTTVTKILVRLMTPFCSRSYEMCASSYRAGGLGIVCLVEGSRPRDSDAPVCVYYCNFRARVRIDSRPVENHIA